MPAKRKAPVRRKRPRAIPFPTHVAKPLPRDFLLPLISHLCAIEDHVTLFTLSLLDKHTNHRVNASLYNIVKLHTPHALVSFFGYFTAHRIKQSRKVAKATDAGDDDVGGDGHGYEAPPGKRQWQLTKLIHHLEVRLSQEQLNGDWRVMVGKLSPEGVLDRGFPNGVLPSLETLHILVLGGEHSHRYQGPVLYQSPLLPCETDWAVAFILSKCSAKHILHQHKSSSHSLQIRNYRSLGSQPVPKRYGSVGSELFGGILRNRILDAKLISFDTPAWEDLNALNMHLNDDMRVKNTRFTFVSPLDDIEELELHSQGEESAVTPNLAHMIVGSHMRGYSPDRVEGARKKLRAAREKGCIRYVETAEEMNAEGWRTWLSRKLWEDPHVGTKDWAEENELFNDAAFDPYTQFLNGQ